MRPIQSTYQMTGTIDASNAEQRQADLLTFVRNSSTQKIIIDFHQVDFIDSSGLMILVLAYQEAQKKGQDFKIAGVSPDVLIIFELSQLDELLSVRDVYDHSHWQSNAIAA